MFKKCASCKRKTKFYKVKNANKLIVEAYTTWMTGKYTNHFTN